jgi:preprotein translocase subunit SecF
VLGIFAILGFFLNVEVDSLFVTAVLTIIGFSVHDTIVVFDRIRENLRLNPGEPLNPVINFSIMQTLARSVITSLTVLLTLLALFLFGGYSVRNFALALLIGIISGTYSSIFNASQIVSLWQELEDRLRHRALVPAS